MNAAPMNYGDPETLAFAFDTAASQAGCLWVNGHSLTAHATAGVIETAVDAPWGMLAAWFMAQWPRFFYAQRWPRPNRAPNALRFARHLEFQRTRPAGSDADPDLDNIAHAFDEAHLLGGAQWPNHLPRVYLNRENDEIVFAWTTPREPRRDMRFLAAEGEGRVGVRPFIAAIEAFLEYAKTIPGGPAPDEVTAWRSTLNSREGAIEALQHQAAMTVDETDALLTRSGLTFETFFGVGPDDLDAGGSISAYASPVALMLRSTTPALDAASRLAIQDFVTTQAPNPRGTRALTTLRERLKPDPRLPDYAQGYAMAVAVRHWLGKPDTPLDIERLLTGMLSIPVHALPLLDPDTDGGCLWGESAGPAIFINPQARMSSTPWGRRMTLAHEFCHLLLDRPQQGTLGHASGIWSVPRLERRANAFAAELLLPQAALVGLRDSGAGYAEAMERYGVGLKTATWQVTNRLDGDLQTDVQPVRLERPPQAMGAEHYQVLFGLLAEPDLIRQPLHRIAYHSGASIHQVEAVIARLTNRELLVREGAGRRLRDRSALAHWWLTGYADVVRPHALIEACSVRLPGRRDQALDALAARLNHSESVWWWSGEAAAWHQQRLLPPQHLVVLFEGSVPVINGDGDRDYPIHCLRLFCPAARGATSSHLVHPLLTWSELMLRAHDARVRELADMLAAELDLLNT